MSRPSPASIVFALAVVLGVSIMAYVDVNQGPTQTSPSSSTLSRTTVTFTVSSASETLATAISGSYYIDNVTGIMIAENPGTFHFDNGSVTFMGVEFQTICTEYGAGCPVPAPPPGTVFVVQSGAGITMNVTFPDHSNETIEGAFPTVPVHFEAFTHHTDPQAGIMIVYTDSDPIYKSYLLVSLQDGTPSLATNSSTSGGAETSSNTVVTTVTMTETLTTTQASQATTTYAIPTSSCTLLGDTVIVPTTTTVGAEPPASTTTVMVTTTSTSYAQTITATSCTYSVPTVISTVTATVTT